MNLPESSRFRRAQIWSTDAMIGSVMIIFIIITTIATWNYVVNVNEDTDTYTRLHLAALNAGDLLVLSSGQPSGWDLYVGSGESSIKSIGLADRRNMLNERKIRALKRMYDNPATHDLAREHLLLGQYNFTMNITDMGGTLLYSIGGGTHIANETANVERFGVLNGSVVKLELEVWQ